MNKKIIWTVIVIIVLGLIIWAVNSNKSPTPAPVAKEPVKIGAALMLTGPVALLGELQNKAITLAVDKINASGGINGRPLEIVTEDAGYDPKQAVSAYQALKLKGLKLFIIDGSPIVAATRKLVTDDGNFSIAAVATAQSYFDGDNRTCRIALTAKTIAPGLSDLAIARGYKKVALLMPDNEYGRGWVDEFTKVFPSKGGTIVVPEFYSAVGTTDYRTNITKIKAAQSGIDAVIVSNVLNTVEPMWQQMKDLGITKPILSDFATLTNPAVKNIALFEGVEFVNYEYSAQELPSDSVETKAFKDAYRAKYASDPIYFAAGHYDAVLLLAKAIGAVGEDPQKVADYISGLKDYKGITGTYSFNSDCEVSRPIVVDKVVGGKFVEVK